MRKLVTRGGGNVGTDVAVGVPNSVAGVELGIGVSVGGQGGVAVTGVVASLNVSRDVCPSLHDSEKRSGASARMIRAAKPNALPTKFNAPFITTTFLLLL